MYTPAAFAERRAGVMHEFMRAHSFALVVVEGEGGLVGTHLPLLVDGGRGEFGVLSGHVAVGNGVWREFERGRELMVVFAGPHAYVSPRWYETKVAVPTWNYAAVHAYGRARVMGRDWLRRHLGEMVEAYEGGAWGVDALPGEVTEKLIAGIVGFEIEVTRLEGKWKMGQNRSEADVRGAVAGLRGTGRAGDAAVAAIMEGCRDGER